MELTRRRFFGHLAGSALIARMALAGATGITAVELSGCNVVTDIENWIPTGEAAVNAILAVLTANSIPISVGVSTFAGLVETGLNDLLAAVKEYQATTPPPVGALEKIQTILQDISDQFSSFTTSLSGVAAKVLAVVESLAEIVISTIGGFVGQLGTSASANLSLRLGARPVAAVHRTRRKFKHDWNSALDSAKKSGVIVPNAAYLKLSLVEHL